MKFFGKTDNLSEIRESLCGVARLLRETCQKAEPSFIALGNELQAVYADANRLMRQTVEAIRIIGGESPEKSLLSEVGALAQSSLSELRSRHANVGVNLDSITSVIVNLSDLHELCSVMERIALFLRIVGLNTDIESSRNPEFTEMFGSVTRDIGTLSKRVLSIVENIRNDTDMARSSQMSACGEISRDLNPLAKLSEDARNVVEDAVRNIGNFTSLSVDAIGQTGKYSRTVSENVAEVVVAIQFHDSMSQRIEHIVKAIEDARQFLGESSPNSKTDGKDARQKRMGAAHAIIELQINQLAHIVSEADNVYRRSTEAFERIGADTAMLPQSLSALGKASAAEKGQDTLTALVSAMSYLRNLLGQGRELLTKIRETTAYATDTTERLSDYLRQVRDFSFQVQLIALNAVIKASHIGREGAALEILAQEVKRISDQTDTFAKEVEIILETITNQARELKRISSHGSKETGKIRAAIDSGISDISKAYEQFRTESADISGQAEDLMRAIEKVGASLFFLPELTEETKRHSEQLEEIARKLNPFAGKHIRETTREVEKLGTRYTMKKERDVHEQTLKSDAMPEVSERTEQDMEDFGKNTELF